MTVPDHEFFMLHQDDADRLALYGAVPEDLDASSNGAAHEPPAIIVETWADFERSATETIPTLIEGLWPEAAFGFIAAPPKKGKTWVGLTLAISVAAGVPAFGRFTVPQARPVIYLALEGHRAAIRGRIGCLARGMGVNPDKSGSLAHLHVIYKPRGLDLAAHTWVAQLQDAILTVRPALIVVDVLRAAASIKENSNDDFTELRRTLQPLIHDGVSIALLHHFGKLTEITKERTPGERMSGGGAMYGALDVGVYVTGSDDGARRLRVEFELRDLATPEPIGLHLKGDPTGVNGGFVYTDKAAWSIEEAPDEADMAANAGEVIAWLLRQPGRQATTAELCYGLECSENTVRRRRQSWLDAGVIWTPAKAKKPAVYSLPSDPPRALPHQTRHGGVAPQKPLDMQEETENLDPPRHDPPNDAGGPKKSADLQDNFWGARGPSPTESTPPLAGHVQSEPPPIADTTADLIAQSIPDHTGDPWYR